MFIYLFKVQSRTALCKGGVKIPTVHTQPDLKKKKTYNIWYIKFEHIIAVQKGRPSNAEITRRNMVLSIKHTIK